jgi:hypothetical protein
MELCPDDPAPSTASTSDGEVQQRRGIATALVRAAAPHAKVAGCEWLHVDCDEALRSFYFDACGFNPTTAGSIHLVSLQADERALS